MNYYDDRDALAERGIDWDLAACLQYNPEHFPVGDIDRVLAVWTGANEGDDWRWIVLLKNGRYVYLRGGCDYTGWDCISWAWSGTYPDIRSCFAAFRESNADAPDVMRSIIEQLTTTKDKTWSETFTIEASNE